MEKISQQMIVQAIGSRLREYKERTFPMETERRWLYKDEHSRRMKFNGLLHYLRTPI
jgi:hypothetical protein